MRRLNQASFVLSYFVLFAFSRLCLVFCSVPVFDLSSVSYFRA